MADCELKSTVFKVHIMIFHVDWDFLIELCTSGSSICGGGTGVMAPSSSLIRSPIVAPIFALACRKLSDNFSWKNMNTVRIHLN